MSSLNDYAADIAAGMQQGAADLGRSAVADIGDSYQEILMSHASIKPADGQTMTMENVMVQAEPEAPAPVPDTDPAPVMPERQIDIE